MRRFDEWTFEPFEGLHVTFFLSILRRVRSKLTHHIDPGLKALGFQPFESKSLSNFKVSDAIRSSTEFDCQLDKPSPALSTECDFLPFFIS